MAREIQQEFVSQQSLLAPIVMLQTSVLHLGPCAPKTQGVFALLYQLELTAFQLS